MAGDWIKVEHTTPDKPEVDRMAEMLGIDNDSVLGKLVRFWTWADQQSISGNALSVTKKLLDRVTHQDGFADALLEVGWLQARSGSFAIPRFDRHNGQTAKSRAVTNRRVAEHRERCNAESVTNVTGPPLQKALPEKRREESKINKNARVTPTLDEVKAAAQRSGIPEDHAAQFWHSVEARPLTPEGGWTTREGQPMNMDRWQSAMAAYSASMTRNIKQKGTKNANDHYGRVRLAAHRGVGDASAYAGL